MTEQHDSYGGKELAAFHRLLAQAGDVVGSIAVFLSWRDLLHATCVSRVAFTSDFRREFERKTRLLLPPDPDLWSVITTRFAVFKPEWSTLSVARIALITGGLTAFPGVHKVVVQPHRFMMPPSLASLGINFTPLLPCFQRLEDLDVSGISELVDITLLSHSTELRRLNVSGTGVQDLLPLSRLRNLQSLDVSKTRIASLEPLRGLHELATLNLDEASQLCNLEPLEGLPRLTSLTVRRVKCENAMEQLTAIAPRLREFACCSKLLQSTRSNDRYDIFGCMLRAMTGVESLEIKSNATIYVQFEDLASLTQLRHLHVSVLPTTDLSPLCALVHLQELSITTSKCVDLSALACLSELQYLYCHGGDPDSMHIAPQIEFLKLKQLDVSNHYLARLTSLPKLEELKVYVWSGDPLMLPIGCASKLLRFRLSGDVTLREIHTRFPDLEELELLQCASYNAHELVLFEKLQSLSLKDPYTDLILPAQPLPQLRFLRLHGANIKHQPHLRSLPNLEVLDLEKTSIVCLNPIKSLKKLRVLNLKDTPVRDVTPLLSIASLEKVVLPKSAVCTPLVDAFHDQSCSLHLREVLHPTKSCLWGPHRRLSRQQPKAEPSEIEDLSRGQETGDPLTQTINKCSIA